MHFPPSELPPLSRPAFAGLAFFFLAVAAAVACLFYAYPTVPWDGDDWANLTKWSWFYPSFDRWNPGRVLQETMSPFCGYLSAYLLRPLLHLPYVQSVIVATALFAGASVMLMAVCGYRLFARMLDNRFFGCCLTAIFLCCFFVGRRHMMPVGFPFEGTCLVFCYYIPNMLNLAMLFYLCRAHFIARQEPESLPAQAWRFDLLKEKATFFSCFLVCAYLTQFSMVSSSIIPAAFAGSVLFFGVAASCIAAGNPVAGIVVFVRRLTCLQVMCLAIVFFWFSAALFEMYGERFSGTMNAESGPIGPALSTSIDWVVRLLPPRVSNFLGFMAGAAALCMIYKAVRKRWQMQDTFFLQSAGIFTLACGIVLTLNVLITRDVDLGPRGAFGIISYIFLLPCVLLAYAGRSAPHARIVLPLLALHAASLMWMAPPWPERPREIYGQRMPIVEQWMSDIRRAEQDGLASVMLYTPTEEWPHPKDRMGQILFRTLFRHGEISRPLEIRTSSAPENGTQDKAPIPGGPPVDDE